MGSDFVALSMQYEQQLSCPPCIRLNGKGPVDQQWTTGPRRQPHQWRQKLEGWTGNIGVVCGNGLVVVDVDLYHPAGQDSLDALRDRGLSLHTVTTLTGGGGCHLYYRADVPIRSGPLPGYPGIDIKGEGGQVVVPPSVHPNGHPYEWEFNFAPGDVELVILGDPLRALLERQASTGESSRDLDERDERAANLLLEHFGGHSPRQRQTTIEVCRPGKERGVSAEVGYFGPGVTKVWTSNWPGLAAGIYELSKLRKLAGVPGPQFTIPEVKTELPDGYRLWRVGDDAIPDPVLARAAYIGPVGAYLDLLEGQTEAHPAAIGIQVLAALGTLIGRRAHYRAGNIVQHCNVFAAVLGPSSEGAKGVADHDALALVDLVVPSFLTKHSIGGLGSGEVLIRELADDQDPPAERRRIVHDAELSSVLKVVKRDGSILGDVLRKAFDYAPLHHSTVQHKRVIASGHHIAVVGSITPGELRALIDEMAIVNGFANRFLYVWSRLTRLLPYGGEIDRAAVSALAEEIAQGLEALEARIKINGTVQCRLQPTALEQWTAFYNEHRTGVGDGILKALSGRHVAHAARLATIYAVLDRSTVIRAKHIDAAAAWCNYSLDSTAKAFTSSVPGKAGKLLEAVRAAMPDGLIGTEVNNRVSHNWKAGELASARAELEDKHLLAVVQGRSTGGRPPELYVALTQVGSK